MSGTEHAVIIGGGAAGLAAGIYLARAELHPVIFAGSPPGGQLVLTSEVENFPGQESVLGAELVETMRKQAGKFGATLIDENVTSVELSDKLLHVVSASGKTVETRSLLIATGAKALWLGLDCEKRLRGKGVSACATCDGFFFRNKTVAVIGGGDSALEEALTLTKFASKVYVIHRRDSFKASRIMQQRVLDNKKIEVIWNAAVEEITGEAKVDGIRLKVNGKEETLAVDGVFVAIGHKPDTDLFQGKIELDKKGYIMTTARAGWDMLRGQEVKKDLFNPEYQTMTSLRGVFAAGDCVDFVYRQASTAAGQGVSAALDMERWLEEGAI